MATGRSIKEALIHARVYYFMEMPGIHVRSLSDF